LILKVGCFLKSGNILTTKKYAMANGRIIHHLMVKNKILKEFMEIKSNIEDITRYNVFTYITPLARIR
jgi:hypothetical protein